MLTSLLIAVAGLVALGVISQHLGAGAGLAEFGRGVQTLISAPLSPQIEPRFEIQIGPNTGGAIKWLQDSWATITAGAPQLPDPDSYTPPIIPRLPSLDFSRARAEAQMAAYQQMSQWMANIS